MPRPIVRVLAWLAVGLVLSCSGEGGTGPSDDSPASLTLSPSSLELFVGEARALTVAVRNASGHPLSMPVTFSSTNPSVASVDAAGVVEGLGAGVAKIEARAGDLVDEVSVGVLPTMDFAFPLEGVLNSDFWYVNYVDLRQGAGLLDYNCGTKTYDGHRGVDLTLPSFARMDAGVRILAVAPGTVSQVTDGAFDRNTVNGPGGFGNHVRVTHRDGFVSIYGHMTNGSILVSTGQAVSAGTPLGLVGSSGNSDMPHLHVEFLRQGAVVDAFQGSCGSDVDHWAAADPYQNVRTLIQGGTTDLEMNLDLVKQPPAQKGTFRTDDERLSTWVHLANVRQGTLSRFEVVAPDGRLFWSTQWVHDRSWGMSWWWAWLTIPGQMTELGTWRVDYFNDGARLAQHSVELVAAGPAATEGPAHAATGSSGAGGGGVRGSP